MLWRDHRTGKPRVSRVKTWLFQDNWWLERQSEIHIRSNLQTHIHTHTHKYSRVSFCDGSFYDDSLLRPLSSLTEHSWLVVHHCRNSSFLSLLNALLALFWCACVSCFYILMHSFKLIVIFPPTTSIKETEKKNQKQLTLHSFLMSSEPQPGPSSRKLKVIWLIFFSIICVIFYIANSLN